MADPRISLEQWRALQAVVDAGGYAQAAEALHKSQSAVTYAVQKIEALLAVKIFEVIGRKARGGPFCSSQAVCVWKQPHDRWSRAAEKRNVRSRLACLSEGCVEHRI